MLEGKKCPQCPTGVLNELQSIYSYASNDSKDYGKAVSVILHWRCDECQALVSVSIPMHVTVLIVK